MSTQDPTPPTRPAGGGTRAGTAPTNQQRLKDGLRTVGGAIWFIFSIALYGLGSLFVLVGRGLIRLSGWDRQGR